jgi:hypothetical protein
MNSTPEQRDYADMQLFVRDEMQKCAAEMQPPLDRYGPMIGRCLICRHRERHDAQ